MAWRGKLPWGSSGLSRQFRLGATGSRGAGPSCYLDCKAMDISEVDPRRAEISPWGPARGLHGGKGEREGRGGERFGKQDTGGGGQTMEKGDSSHLRVVPAPALLLHQPGRPGPGAGQSTGNYLRSGTGRGKHLTLGQGNASEWSPSQQPLSGWIRVGPGASRPRMQQGPVRTQISPGSCPARKDQTLTPDLYSTNTLHSCPQA